MLGKQSTVFGILRGLVSLITLGLLAVRLRAVGTRGNMSVQSNHLLRRLLPSGQAYVYART